MLRRKSRACSLFASAVCFGSGFLLMAPARAGTEVLVDNKVICANLNNYIPGETSGEHEHKDPRFIFVLQPGTLESTDPAGASTDRAFQVGACLYSGPIRHNVRNTGRTEATLLEVEIKGARGPRDGTLPCLEPGFKPSSSFDQEADSGGKPQPHRRMVLLKGPELIVSRIELQSGARERATRGRRDRLVYVLSGGALESKMPNGKRVIATQGSAVWIDGSAPLIAQDNSDLVLLEIEPLTGPKP